MKKLCMMSCVAILVLAMSGLSLAASMKGKGAQASIPETNPVLMDLAGETPDQPGLIDNPAFTASLYAMTPPVTEDLSQLGGVQEESFGEVQNFQPQAAIQQSQPNVVPEPTTLLLVGVGLIGLAGVYRTRR